MFFGLLSGSDAWCPNFFIGILICSDTIWSGSLNTIGYKEVVGGRGETENDENGYTNEKKGKRSTEHSRSRRNG